MTHSVHLEMTSDFADWLVSELWWIVDQKIASPVTSTLHDLASRIAMVQQGQVDTAGAEGGEYQVISP